jgi:hypothetical protein
MELFGFVCSAFCKGKAEDQKMDLPVYEHQKVVVENKQWRKIGRIATAISLLVLAILGVWFWYAWFGSVPKVAFSVKLTEPGYSGQCRLASPNQMILLHGGLLARYDMKAKKEVWSRWLIDKQNIAADAAHSLEQMKIRREKAIQEGLDPTEARLPKLPDLVSRMEKSAAAALHLYVQGENVWVAFPDKLARFEWQTGQPAREMPLTHGFRRLLRKSDELLMVGQDGTSVVTHINLVSGETRQEEISEPTPMDQIAPTAAKPAARNDKQLASAARSAVTARPSTNVPTDLSAASGAKPLDPAAVAAQVQNTALPGRIALPALLAADANQQRLQAELRDQPTVSPRASIAPGGFERSELIPAPESFVQFSVTLLESKFIQRQAMKAPPKKSTLDGDVTVSSTTAVANEILNDIQRDRGADTVREDVSRYQVTLRHPGAATSAAWTGEVVGEPHLFPLQTVDVLVAGNAALVFDKASKKLWETKLSFPVTADLNTGWTVEVPFFGQGPCVERDGTLYLFDAGVLAAFDLSTGNARWRLPSVGVAGLFFDDKGMMYVNSTSASGETLKYSRQIDVTQKTRSVVLKLNAETGKILWQTEPQGLVSYVSGKFIYTTEWYEGDEGGDGIGVKTGFEVPPHIRIRRLDPGNGRMLWEHYERRAPLDVRFDRNTIQLLFKKELQLLKFIAL